MWEEVHTLRGITSIHTEFELQDGPQTNGLLTSFDAAACVAWELFIIIAYILLGRAALFVKEYYHLRRLLEVKV